MRMTIAPETHFLDVFAPSGDEIALDASTFDEFWSRFTQNSQFAEFHLDPSVVATSVHWGRDYRPATIFRVMLEEYARKQNKPRWGEKTPEHYRHIDRLFEWFPDARVVHMLRDPRAVCASLLTVPWRTQAGTGVRRFEPVSLRRSRRIYHDAVVWRDSYLNYHTNWRNDARVRVFWYEDLVQNPAEAAGAVCEFLDEPFDPEMVVGRSWEAVPPPPRGADSTLLDWRYHHVRQTLGKITTVSMNKWRTQLSAWEVSVIEHICGDTMERCRYAPEQNGGGSAMVRSMGVAALAGAWAVRNRLIGAA
jgi:hypothetical protein